MTTKFRLLLLCLLVGGLLPAQNSDQNKLRDAKVFFSHQRYADALSVLTSSRQLVRFDKEAQFLIAVCQYQTNRLDEAQQILRALTAEDKSPYPECWLYLAKIYHAQHRFKEASSLYKTYLRSIFPNDPNRRMVVEEIRRCANGIDLQFQKANVVAENLGVGVNSAGDEFAPLASPNHGDRLYFSATRPQNTGGLRDPYGKPDLQWGRPFSDLYATQVTHGSWGKAKPMHYLLNSPKHEVLMGFSQDGLALFYFKGWDFSRGEIVVDTFKNVEERSLSSTPLPGPLRPDMGDNYPVFYADTLVIFASNRPGGYGGWDLYKCSKENGRWLLPVNLGPTINTAYDETTPFLANDGQTLYFSSNDSRKSIGGLDVFKTYFIPQKNQWIPPKNIGMPINSASDDAFFKVSRDGFTGFFASSRKDGHGQRDIYIAYFQDFLPEMEYPANYYASPPTVETPISVPDTPPVQEERPSNVVPVETTDPVEFTPNNTASFDPPANSVPNENIEFQSTSTETIPTAPAVNVANTNSYSTVFLEGTGPSPSQYDMLDQVSDKLIRQPDLRIVITAYNERNNSATGVALFEAIKKAESVAKYLQRKGVSGQQVFMRGALLEGTPKGNDAVELAFTTRSGRMLEAELPILGLSPTGTSNLIINDASHYKIQVASAQKAIKEAYLEGFPYPMIEKTPDFDYYRYTLGAFTNRREAERFQQKMKANGRTSAFIATYQQGWRMKR